MSETWNWKINRKSSQLRIIQIIWVKNKQHNRKLAGCDLMTSAQSRQDEMKNSVTIKILDRFEARHPGSCPYRPELLVTQRGVFSFCCWAPLQNNAGEFFIIATHLYWNWLENNFKQLEKHSNMWNSNSKFLPPPPFCCCSNRRKHHRDNNTVIIILLLTGPLDLADIFDVEMQEHAGKETPAFEQQQESTTSLEEIINNA